MSPVRTKWFFRGIGEGSRNGFAFIFEDTNSVLIAIRNDDGLLGSMPDNQEDRINIEESPGSLTQTMEQFPGEFQGMEKLFLRSDGSPERKITLDAFNALFQGGMSMEDLRAALKPRSASMQWKSTPRF